MITNSTCTGCGACAAACPRSCIQMRPDRLGRSVPVIDKTQCSHCGLCKRICPQNYPPAVTEPRSCFAAWSADPEDRCLSASGGIGVAMARQMLTLGGAVYGCDYTPDGELFHFRLKGPEDLSRIRGSKYSRSDAFGCFREIKALLKAHTPVLFTGTPCQVAGLRSYLGKDYPELITTDLVCHGTPPTAYLRQHLLELGIAFPVDRITFRGQQDRILTVWKDGRPIYQEKWQDDAYYTGFYANAISYDACYTCRYANHRRCSDITLGDFWGLGKLETFHPQSNRPSLILVNTEKGQQFFDDLSQALLWEDRPTEEGIQGNGRLLHPPGKPRRARLFQLLYRSRLLGFDRAVWLSGRLDRAMNKCKKLLPQRFRGESL